MLRVGGNKQERGVTKPSLFFSCIPFSYRMEGLLEAGVPPLIIHHSKVVKNRKVYIPAQP